MCGRYVITKPLSKTKGMVKYVVGVTDADNYNAHPTQKLPVLKNYTNGKTLEVLQWGLTPVWAQERNLKLLINARLETLKEKMSFKNLINESRCVVLADGYYEWKVEENKKTPYYFTRKDNQTLFLAAIYKSHQFMLITRPADSNIGTVHHRQPVIISAKDVDDYFNLEIEGTYFLISHKSPELKFHPVSKALNKPSNNKKELIDKLINRDEFN